MALVTLAGYLLLTLALLARLGDAREFAEIGTRFVTRPGASTLIGPDLVSGTHPHLIGYDGQFVLFIALDPLHAAPYIDNPPYRYGRILYPLLARTLSDGDPAALPLALVLLNLAAVMGGTWAVAAWCVGRGGSPWWALVYPAYVGQVIAYTRDLTEPLAYALAAGAILAVDQRSPRLVPATILFALAALTRETTLLLALLWAGRVLLARPPGTGPRWLAAGAMFAGAALPLLAWHAALWAWLGRPGLTSGPGFALPGSGLLALDPASPSTWMTVGFVVLPLLACGMAGALALARQPAARREVAVWALLAHVVFLLSLVPASLDDLPASSRIMLGGVLVALYSRVVLGWGRGFAVPAIIWVGAGLVYSAAGLIAGGWP